MNEMYEEILVSAKDDGKSRVLSILLFVIGVIGLAGGMWIHVALLLVGIAAFVGAILWEPGCIGSLNMPIPADRSILM